MKTNTIPIKNIYYFLAYAWDIINENWMSKTGIENYSDPLDFFIYVLCNKFNQHIKNETFCDYIEHHRELKGIRGKIDFQKSLSKNLFSNGKTFCVFDEYCYNNLQTQIIKSTILIFKKNSKISKELEILTNESLSYLKTVAIIDLSPRIFRTALSDNRRNVKLLLNICFMIFNSYLSKESEKSYNFIEYLKEKKKMDRLFEKFVLNFYKRKLLTSNVSPIKIKWSADRTPITSSQYLPEMRTDITISSENETIIMDTKYYKSIFSERFEKKSIHSNNLYQLLSYLENFKRNFKNCCPPRGILLYPVTTSHIHIPLKIWDYDILVTTVNLAEPWESISYKLLDLINFESENHSQSA